MAIQKPRNRLMVLRLSQEEYEALRAISQNRGARTLSDFTRTALLAAIANGDAAEHESLGDVCRAISTLQDVVSRMSDKLEAMAGQGSSLREPNKA